MNRGQRKGNIGSWRTRYPVAILNAAGETIPPYAVIQLGNASSIGSDSIYYGAKPTGSASAKYVINSPGYVPVGLGLGAATDSYPIEALIVGTPALNQELGPVNGSWALSTSGKGFVYLGGLAGGVGRVAAKSGTTAGDDFPLVRIVNTTSTLLPLGSVSKLVAVADPAPTYKNRVKQFNFVQPTQGEPYAVTLANIGIGEIGDAAPVGVVDVPLYYTDTSHNYADATTNNSGWLTSGTKGTARILWRERGLVIGAGTFGLQWARVLLASASASTPAATEDVRGYSVATITKATTQGLGSPITPGIGQVQLYTLPADGMAAGTAWAKGEVATAENWMFDDIQPYKPLLLRASRKDESGATIYIVTAEGCKAISG